MECNACGRLQESQAASDDAQKDNPVTARRKGAKSKSPASRYRPPAVYSQLPKAFCRCAESAYLRCFALATGHTGLP
jgi:hypothetical protein